jgi:thioredoxin reductase (NADPH)
MNEIFDCIIVGAGPAGLAAAIYASRDRFKTLVLEKFMPGGQINNTDRIENYPGIEQIDGPGLIQNMQKQAESFGAEIRTGCEVEHLEKQKDGNIAINCNGEKLLAKVIILTPGSDYRKLNVPGEDKFRGSGVSYCGTCDAPFFRGKHVVSIGGGNSAVEETLHLTKFAQKVTMIHRREEFRASKVLVEELLAKAKEPNSNLIIKYNTIAAAIQGQKKVESITLKNVKNNTQEDYPCDGVFVFVGMVPNTGFLKEFVELSEQGFIKCECAYLRTSVPGVFAAGDCRVGAAMQLATASGDGVVAAMMMKQYLRDPKWWNEPVSDSLQPGGW